jgi:hypothetical protein
MAAALSLLEAVGLTVEVMFPADGDPDLIMLTP